MNTGRDKGMDKEQRGRTTLMNEAGVGNGRGVACHVWAGRLRESQPLLLATGGVCLTEEFKAV
jgi:hypothetical protein